MSTAAKRSPDRIPDEWQQAHRAEARSAVRASYRRSRRPRSIGDRTVWWLAGAVLLPVAVLLALALQSPAPLVTLLALSAVIAVGVVGGRLFAAALLQAGAEPASWEPPARNRLRSR